MTMIAAPSKNINRALLNELFGSFYDGQTSSVTALIRLITRPPIPFPAMIAAIYFPGIKPPI